MYLYNAIETVVSIPSIRTIPYISVGTTDYADRAASLTGRLWIIQLVMVHISMQR
jgi:hypothetical protein